MCGIIGIASKESNVAPHLLESLKRLEYRGYDSAGIATVSNGSIHVLKAVGKVDNLATVLNKTIVPGSVGIGHTRWASHGTPNDTNAHPIFTKHVAVVHNGIIENYQTLRHELEQLGYKFITDTDTEVIAQLAQYHSDIGESPKTIVRQLVKKLTGLYSFVIMFLTEPNMLIGVKNGLPLAIGVCSDQTLLGSDAFTLSPYTDQVVYMSDQEIAYVTPANYRIEDFDGNPITKDIHKIHTYFQADRDGFSHYVLKEIYEQPMAISRCFSAYCDIGKMELSFDKLIPTNSQINWSNVSKIHIIGCGTSYYTGLVAKYWMEEQAKISVEVDIASEFRYRDTVLQENTLFIFISQSGETADTLGAIKHIRSKGLKTVAVVNVAESSIANIADIVLPIHAGPEVGVVSTKAFTCQLTLFYLLSLYIANHRTLITKDTLAQRVTHISQVMDKVQQILALTNHIKKVAIDLKNITRCLYVGRGISYPIAMEGALKFKEVSYIPAEGIAAGELKHGPIAMVDNTVPVFVIAPHDKLFAKTASNLREIEARGGKVILLSNKLGVSELGKFCCHHITMPDTDDFSMPITYAIALQLFAYHFAVSIGHDVDRPRNLAKSVTIE